MDPRHSQILRIVWVIVLVIIIIGALAWGWTSITGRSPAVSGGYRFLYGVVGVAGIIAIILVIYAIMRAAGKKELII